MVRLSSSNLPSVRSHLALRAAWGVMAAAFKVSRLCHEMSANVHKDPPEYPQKSFYGDYGL